MEYPQSITRYTAVPMSVRMSDYGYWVVTYSVAPGVYMPVVICQTGISPDTALSLAAVPLAAHTGQKVSAQ
jgi:hypothetical protein